MNAIQNLSNAIDNLRPISLVTSADCLEAEMECGGESVFIYAEPSGSGQKVYVTFSAKGEPTTYSCVISPDKIEDVLDVFVQNVASERGEDHADHDAEHRRNYYDSLGV